MTLGGSGGLSEDAERLVARALQACLAGLMLYGLATGRLGMAANGLFALAVTLLPALLRHEYGYTMDARLVLWLTVAVVLHVIGSLGLYTQFSWYDEIAHTVSATVVAGAGYAAFRALEEHSAAVDVPPEFRALFVVVFVLAFGVLWEVFEFAAEGAANALGVGAPVVVFGLDDIVTDFLFNGVGALLVALWGTDHFEGLVGFIRNRAESDGEK